VKIDWKLYFGSTKRRKAIMDLLVSILIPAYNAGKWIGETIESALAQTWAKKEIIIVDDGSTDRTIEIAKKYQSKILKIVSQENQGSAVARNKALEHAQGDYIQWLDADDLLSPEKIEKQLRAIDGSRNSRILLTSSWARFYYRPQKAKIKPDNLWRDLAPVEWLITRFNENVWMNPAVWLVSRKLTDLAGPWDKKTAPDDDGEYICRVVVNSEKVKFVTESRNYYRQSNPKSLSSDLSEKAVEKVFYSHTLCIGYLQSLEDSERSRAACLRLLQNDLKKFYPKHTVIMKKANELADELGGRLSPPVLNWKHSSVTKMVGPRLANRAKNLNAVLKASIVRNWDKLLYDLSNK
jgi:glycosyltransferase involved in cell wall biosynthesis